MRTCPKCKTEHASDSTARCRACDTPLGGASEGANRALPDDDLEFQVYEQDRDDREFVGGAAEFDRDDSPRARSKSEPTANDDDAPIETLAGATAADPDFAPVHSTSAFIPDPAIDEPIGAPESSGSEEPEELTESGKIRRLSEEEVKSIASSLYRKDNYLTEKDKADLMQKLGDKEKLFTGSAPIEPPKRKERDRTSADDILAEIDPSIPSPKMAGRGRGIAFYYKNIIQIKGSQHISPGDDLVVANRTYELRPKRVGQRPMLIGGSIIFAAVLIFVASLLVSDPSGQGRIAGIVMGNDYLPVSQDVRVRFPELGQSFPVNAQGMFYTDNLPSGSHKVEVVRGGKTWSSDFATVTDGEISLIALYPKEPTAAPLAIDEPASIDQPSTDEVAPAPSVSVSPTTAATPRPSPSTPAGTTSDGVAKIALAANVEGASLLLNGSPVGVGNLTFDRLKPGTYTYKVTRDGYSAATGQITLTSGKTQKLAVSLQPLATAQKEQSFSDKDYYFAGLSAVQERDFQSAIPDLEKAISQNPGHADAHYALGDARSGLRDWNNAHDAYLRAAEIYRFSKDYNRAITAYNEAIRCNDKSVPALLGRADLFLQRGDQRAATIDFEQVIRLDRRQVQAYIGLGRTRLTQGMPEQAVKHFKDARSLDSQNPVIYQYLMLCYMANSNFDEVRKSYNKFAEVASQDQITELHSDQRYAAVMRVVNGRP